MPAGGGCECKRPAASQAVRHEGFAARSTCIANATSLQMASAVRGNLYTSTPFACFEPKNWMGLRVCRTGRARAMHVYML